MRFTLITDIDTFILFIAITIISLLFIIPLIISAVTSLIEHLTHRKKDS